MTNEEFERFREYSVGQMARFFSALDEMRIQNDEEHRQIRAELRAAVREGIRYVREARRERQETRRDIQALRETLQAFIDSLRRGGNGEPPPAA